MTISASRRQQSDTAEPNVLHDSFLVRKGRILDLEAHIARLASAGRRSPEELHRTYAAALREALDLPVCAFPGVTLHPTGRLTHQVRPVEPSALQTTVRLWTPPEPDRRRHPRLKGPDFPHQRALRDRAIAHGADEAVLVGPDSVLREGCFSSIVHWSDERLVLSGAPERLPSVTEKALVRVARRLGVPVLVRQCSLEQVRAADEVWTLSSLHGIRRVTTWDGASVQDAGHAAAYREALQALETDIRPWLAKVAASTHTIPQP